MKINETIDGIKYIDLSYDVACNIWFIKSSDGYSHIVSLKTVKYLCSQDRE